MVTSLLKLFNKIQTNSMYNILMMLAVIAIILLAIVTAILVKGIIHFEVQL